MSGAAFSDVNQLLPEQRVSRWGAPQVPSARRGGELGYHPQYHCPVRSELQHPPAQAGSSGSTEFTTPPSGWPALNGAFQQDATPNPSHQLRQSFWGQKTIDKEAARNVCGNLVTWSSRRHIPLKLHDKVEVAPGLGQGQPWAWVGPGGGRRRRVALPSPASENQGRLRYCCIVLHHGEGTPWESGDGREGGGRARGWAGVGAPGHRLRFSCSAAQPGPRLAASPVPLRAEPGPVNTAPARHQPGLERGHPKIHPPVCPLRNHPRAGGRCARLEGGGGGGGEGIGPNASTDEAGRPRCARLLCDRLTAEPTARRPPPRTARVLRSHWRPGSPRRHCPGCTASPPPPRSPGAGQRRDSRVLPACARAPPPAAQEPARETAPVLPSLMKTGGDLSMGNLGDGGKAVVPRRSQDFPPL
nr:uncharacterized protein LOC132598220 [Globicephala melas]